MEDESIGERVEEPMRQPETNDQVIRSLDLEKIYRDEERIYMFMLVNVL